MSVVQMPRLDSFAVMVHPRTATPVPAAMMDTMGVAGETAVAKPGTAVVVAAVPTEISRQITVSRNIEIKAHIESIDALSIRAAAIASEGPIQMTQDDTFFRCESGRLKLRAFSDGTGELIFYRRANQQGPKESFYVRSPTSAPDSLRESLSLAYGEIGRVRKQRTLFLVGRTRIHLDEVECLGLFLELEVVLNDDEPSEVGICEAHELMRKLDVKPHQLIEDAYVDLLARQGV
jgi:predicted adenylyl cyclase CyaB